jgi:hypothetical protein
MKRNITGRFAAFAAGLFALSAFISCATAPAPQPEPEWYGNMDAVYPRERFIAFQGRGSAPAEARQNALADLAAYFEQEVRKEGTASISMTEQQGAVEKTRRIEETVTVTVSRNLSAVRYAEDAWKHPATGVFVTVAYLDRDEAWKAYSPQATQAALTLADLFQGAKEEADPFTRSLLFGKAEAYMPEFIAARSFAQILHPARAEALFEEADRDLAALPKEAADARRNAAVYLDCPLDLDGLVRNAAASAFNVAGFPAAAERRGAAAVCVIQVNEGLMKRPAGTFYYPELSGVVTGRSGATVFTFTAKAESQAARDPELARRRAYTALAQAVRDTLPEQLTE